MKQALPVALKGCLTRWLSSSRLLALLLPLAAHAQVITSFAPTSGPIGTSVIITGTGLGGATSVSFNGATQTTFASNTVNQIVLTVPCRPGPASFTTACGG